ncbi:MAG: family 16 glycosylhydrolase [Planctomycetes bacterium]|nr:family 16 glycosylhydrolase [Planctomycetota bacterium]
MFKLLIAICVIVVTAAAQAQELPGWKLTFDDEFNGDTLDVTKWTPADPWGRERNNELQAYVPEAITLKDGVLHIRADRGAAKYAGRMRQYTSGMMTTAMKFAQRYGRFEFRFRAPAGRGFWPAIWMLPNPPSWPPEIDVMELIGHEPDKVHMTHHWHDAEHRLRSDTAEWTGPDFSADFHTIAVEWTPTYIAWFIDGVERQRSTRSIPDTPMFILLNLAVGGDWPGPPDANTKFPSDFQIDYVRVYEKNEK